MRRLTVTAAAAVAMTALLLGMIGCKDTGAGGAAGGGKPQTAIERFAKRIGALQGKALEDTLRQLAVGAPPERAYAAYLLGNRYYTAAGDSALARGWKEPAVIALLDSAEARFMASIAADSTLLEPMVNLGSLWDDRAEQTANQIERQDFSTKAESFYNLALRVDPKDEKARCNLGSLYLRQRKHPQAIAAFKSVLADNPKSALAHYNMAIMFAESKIYQEAVSEWELAVANDPTSDIGRRSAENIKIVRDLMNAPDPTLGK